MSRRKVISLRLRCSCNGVSFTLMLTTKRNQVVHAWRWAALCHCASGKENNINTIQNFCIFPSLTKTEIPVKSRQHYIHFVALDHLRFDGKHFQFECLGAQNIHFRSLQQRYCRYESILHRCLSQVLQLKIAETSPN